jgi:hypothetical protein
VPLSRGGALTFEGQDLAILLRSPLLLIGCITVALAGCLIKGPRSSSKIECTEPIGGELEEVGMAGSDQAIGVTYGG